MVEPRVPGTDDADDADSVELPCGESAHVSEFDLGMREYECACGETHAIVMDMHPPSRFVPESIVEVLESAVEPAEDDAFEEFGTPHLMGAVLEDYPEEVTATDASESGDVGYALLWVTEFDARELHEIVVELVVELMEHAISHADSEDAATEFEEQMLEFDVAEFVDQYRSMRDFEDEYDEPA